MSKEDSLQLSLRTPDPAPGNDPLGAEKTASHVAPVEIAFEPYIDKHEVARRLGRTTRAVDNLVRRRAIPFYKFDWQVSFRWSEIQAHLARTSRVCGPEGGA